jgi:hypothetical protein
MFLEVIKSYTQILKFFYYPLWPIAKFVSFLLWMMIATVICYITKLMEESKETGKGGKKKTWPWRRQTRWTYIRKLQILHYMRESNEHVPCEFMCVYIYTYLYAQLVCVWGGCEWGTSCNNACTWLGLHNRGRKADQQLFGGSARLT